MCLSILWFLKQNQLTAHTEALAIHHVQVHHRSVEDLLIIQTPQNIGLSA